MNMRGMLWSLLPVVAAALAGMAALVAWIRVEPLAVPRSLQIALAAGLVAAVALLLLLVRRLGPADTET